MQTFQKCFKELEMTIQKKRALASIFAGLCTVAFAEIKFTNVVSSDIVDYYFLQDEKDQFKTKSGADFAGVKERFDVQYTSKDLDFGALAEITLDNQYGSNFFFYNGENNDYYNSEDGKFKSAAYYDIKFTDLDVFLEFRAYKYLTLFLSDEIYANGSTLPVANMSMASGNIGSDLGLMVPFNTKVGKLRFAAGADVISYFLLDRDDPLEDVWTGETIGGEHNDIDGFYSDGTITIYSEDIEERYPKLNAGVDFSTKNNGFTIGAAARNVMNDERSIGGYVSFKGNGWELYTGGAYNNVYDYKWSVNNQYPNAEILGFIKDYRVEGMFLYTLGLAAHNEKLELGFDLVTNFGINKDDPFTSADDADKWDIRTKRAWLNKQGKTYAHYYSGFDLYAGLKGVYHFTPAFQASLVLKGIGDFNPARRTNTTSGDSSASAKKDDDDSDDPISLFPGRSVVFEVAPTFSYTHKQHTFSVGADVIFADPYVTLAFPTSWTFRY